MTQTYPLIQFSKTLVGQGTYTKTVLLPSSFSTNKQNKIFISEKSPLLIATHKATIKKENGFHLELLFHGLNYNMKRIRLFRPKYFIDVHKSEVYICNELAANSFKSRVHKRRLIFFSFDNDLIEKIKVKIKAFKMPNLYTGKGIYTRTDSYVIKEGKKR